jgi:PIN domain nuclease of toxin-antitoxin system
MKLLLDAHTFIWFIAGDSRLSKMPVQQSKTQITTSGLAWQAFGRLQSNIVLVN